MYQSQSDKERFCQHYTVKREHALPLKIMATTLFSRFCSIFLLFLSYFVKPSRAPIKQSKTKLLSRFCRILTIRFSEIRQQIRVTRELLNQTARKTFLLKKTSHYHTGCFRILHGTICQICPLRVQLTVVVVVVVVSSITACCS